MSVSWLYFRQKSLIPKLLVAIQFFCIFYILFTGGFIPDTLLGGITFFLGIAIGSWAVWAMRKSKLNVSPDPFPDFKLIHHGPYRIIRHPMYLAIIITFSPIIWEEQSVDLIIVMAILFINLNLKLLYEEQQILKKDPEYFEYKKRTWRLIPLLY